MKVRDSNQNYYGRRLVDEVNYNRLTLRADRTSAACQSLTLRMNQAVDR